jgi:TetR/AcrR family transcriptional regulator, transcriptional repressor for nem operon
MRYDKNHKAETSERIVTLASVQIRKHGVDNLRVAELMHMAGLTHGGFYHHFSSREDLINRAFAHAMKESVGRWRRIAARAGVGKSVSDIVTYYLTEQHRLDVGKGCALPALGAEVPRASAKSRRAFTAGLREMIEILAEQTLAEPAVTSSKSARRDDAIAELSLIVGSVLLARAVDDAGLVDELLRAGKQAVLNGASTRRPALRELGGEVRPKTARSDPNCSSRTPRSKPPI